MSIDPSIPLRVNVPDLAGMYVDAQDRKQREQMMAQRQAQMEREQQERDRESQREQAGMIAQLTSGVGDDATYQQRLQAARQYGIDVSGAPTSYDPAWVQTQNIIASTFLKPDGEKKLTTTAQELAEAGLEPGTPEFQRAMAQRIVMQDSKVVTTTAGGMAGVYGQGGYQPFILPNDGSQPAGASAQGETKTVGGKTYYKVGGRWFDEPPGFNPPQAGGVGGNVGGPFLP